jgi:GAF domain-containing protein
LQPEEIYSAIHNAATRLMPVEAFVIVRHEGDSRLVKPVYLIDRSGHVPDRAGSVECGLSNLVISTGQSTYIPNTSASTLQSDIISLNDPGQVSSVLAVSMRLRGKVVGMLAVQTFQPEAYTTEDVSLLEMLASYAAIALDNATLFQSIQQLAITDPLTGVHNRRHLYDLGQHEFQRAKRFKRPLSALMVDIDRFKNVNDQYGHATGDAVLSDYLVC